MANPTYNYTVTHTNVPNLTTLYWRILDGVNGDKATDFPARDTGTVTADGSTSTTIQLEVEEQTGTEGTRSYTLEVSLSATYTNAQTLAFDVVDGGQSFSWDDGASFTITETQASRDFDFTVTGAPTSGTVYWNITTDALGTTQVGAGQFSAVNSGGTGVAYSSGTGTVAIDATADGTTEGDITYYLQLRTGSDTGTIVDTLNLTVTDDSQAGAPTYTIQGSDPLTVSEVAAAQTITVNTTNVTNGTVLYWNITTDAPGTTQASTDWAAYNSGGTGFTINSNTGTFDIDALADTTTEGAETYYLHVRTGSDTGTSVDSIQLDITDDSQTPAGNTFQFDPNLVSHTSSGASSVTGDTVNSNVTFGRDGTLTILGTSLFGTLTETITPAVGSDNWTDGSGANFGDNYQLFVQVRTAAGGAFTGTDGDGNDAYSMSGTTAANSWTQDGLGTGWMQMNGDLTINCRQVRGGGSPGTQTNVDGGGNGADITIQIKEYAGSLGTGTTVLTKLYENVVSATTS